MLYLETPIGVGFSYLNSSSYVSTNDKITGMYKFILDKVVPCHCTYFYIWR